MTRTFSPKAAEITRNWVILDAQEAILGRLASQAAALLRGKHKPGFAPHLDTGDYVIIINAEKVRLSGAKLEQKMVYRHSGYPGGLSTQTFAEALAKNPQRAVERAVRGMLPKNTLGRALFRKLKVYAGPEHPHRAQQPVPYETKKIRQLSAATPGDRLPRGVPANADKALKSPASKSSTPAPKPKVTK